MRNVNRGGKKFRMVCAGCGAQAQKRSNTSGSGSRWIIKHARSCVEFRGSEDIGPVTALNDPENVVWRQT